MTSTNSTHSASYLRETLSQLDAKSADYATRFVEVLLAAAQGAGASDVHLQPLPVQNSPPRSEAEGNARPAPAGMLLVKWRLDGVLQEVGLFARGESADVVTRLKVLADLLTYKTDLPQEGRIRQGPTEVETRVSTFPTLHGERAVVRLFATAGRLLFLEDLGLPGEALAEWHRLLAEPSGAILITGPAGSGKTTTLYAALRQMVRESGGARGLVSLEDPIESAVGGVAQSQMCAAAGFDLATALRSVLRQDPEVIAVGEMRDRATAEGALAAALTGHLVLTTFHAGSASGALARLAEMELESYQLRSGLLAVFNQRLLRRLCSCAVEIADPAGFLGLPVRRAWQAAGCPACRYTGYVGRFPIVEMLSVSKPPIGRALLAGADAAELEAQAASAGLVSRWQRACAAVEEGQTTPAEVRRALGFNAREA